MSKSTKIIAALGVVAGLGVAAMPLSSYATVKSPDNNTDLQMTVNEVLSIEASAADAIAAFDGGEATTKATTNDITVKTNARKGYNVVIAGVGASDRFVNDKAERKVGLVNEYGDIIAPVTGGTKATPAALTNANKQSSWGYRITAVSGAHKATEATDATGGAKYIAVTADGAEAFAETEATDSTGNKYSIEYGVGVSSDLPAGIYKGTVKYTVTSNAGTPESA